MDKNMRLGLVAKMYYVDRMKQSEIAEVLNTSTMLVSRLLKRAEAEGIITITVKSPDNIDWEAGARLKRRYPQLREALVTNVQEGESERIRLGQVTARYVQEIMTGNSVVGVSWGRSIREFARACKSDKKNEASIVQMSGGFLCAGEEDMMPSNLVKTISENLQCRAVFLNAPLLAASKELRDMLIADPGVNYVHKVARRMDIAVYGLSRLSREATMAEVGAVTEEDLSELRSKGAIGDVMGYFLDEKGNFVDWSKSRCYVGVSLDAAAAAKHAICVGSGREKAPVLKQAILKRYCNTLIITSDLAKQLV